MDKKAERLGRDKVLRRLAKGLRCLGLERTKPTFFTRPCSYWVEFGHVHKFTFGPYFRVHLGIRVLADTNESVALNGPDSDRIRDPLYLLCDHRKYNFEYAESPVSIETCVEDILIFWRKVAEPWFKRWQDPNKLIESKRSPLSAKEKEVLAKSVRGSLRGESADVTRKLLGLD